jgi:hypothetical protein
MVPSHRRGPSIARRIVLLAIAVCLAALFATAPASAAINNYAVNCRQSFEYKDSAGTWRLGTYIVEVRVTVDSAQGNKITGGPWLNKVSVSPSSIRENVNESYSRSGQTVYIRATGSMSNGALISCSKSQTVR